MIADSSKNKDIRPPYFPMMIDLNGKIALVIGGGQVAARRADTLIRCGAEVVAVSPEFCQNFPESARRIKRPFMPDDICRENFALVVAATNNREVNAQIHSLARSHGIPVNVCDSQSECDFFFASLINHDNVAVSVCTAGISAALTKKLSDKLRKVWDLWVSEGI